jgi:uroporphyrinogen-III synthase
MGEGSLAALRRYVTHEAAQILSPPTSAAQDSEALIQLIEQRKLVPRLRRALFIKGQGGRRVLLDWFTQQGAATAWLEVYRRVPVVMTEAIRQCLQRSRLYDQVDIVLTSSEGAQAVATLCRQEAGLGAHLFQKTVFTTHARVADVARSVGFERVRLCPPGQAALLAALESTPP